MSTSSKTSLRQVQLKRIRHAEETGRPALAVQLREAFRRIYPDHVPTWISLAAGLVGMARYEEARRILLQAIPLCPVERLAIPYAQMGHLYQQRGNLRRAALWYTKVVAASPAEADGYVYLGGALALSGDLSGALEQHQLATRCSSGCIEEAHYNCGLVLRAQKRYEEAALAFRDALKLDPRYLEAKRALSDMESVLKMRDRSPNKTMEPTR